MSYRKVPARGLLAGALLICAGGCGGGSGSGSGGGPVLGPPPSITTLDLASIGAVNGFRRISGAASTGRFGVPVAGGFDCDNDGHLDVAMSGMQAAPFGRAGAGQVLLVFGDGGIGGDLDTAQPQPDALTIAGAGPAEAAGSEIWMDDVTGDGIGDLLIGRQNYREPVSNRIGAGALTVLVGGATLRDLARDGTILDLAAPPPSVTTLTLVGAAALDRLGIWMRTGDVTGDGIVDVLVGADQTDGGGDQNRGAAWLLRGGAHLDADLTVDLAAFGSTALAGHLVQIDPPRDAPDYHFGATVALADLDANGRSEVLVAASLSRVGGLLVADGAPPDSAVRNGGNPGGSLFILWDDNFPAGDRWVEGFTFAVDAAPGSTTRIDGGSVAGVFANDRFAEELNGGGDYDGDGTPDLFAGDIHGTAAGRIDAGVGHVFFDAARLINMNFSMDAVPAGVRVTTILGPSAGAISCDTSLQGDIDGDGRVDLVVASPLASPNGRVEAGTIHVLWGQPGPWPAQIDLAAANRPAGFAITDLLGAQGATSSDDAGDTLMYSAAAADLDGDGRSDMIVNEMRGNGVAPDALDTGNLLVISGTLVPRP